MFEELQEAVREYLQGVRLLNCVSANILTRKESNVDALVDEAMAEGIGLSVVVLYPFPEVLLTEVEGIACAEISLMIQVQENVQSNSTGLSALKCAEYIHRALHLFVPASEGLGHNPIVAQKEQPWRDPETEPGINKILLMFKTTGFVGPLLGALPANPVNGNYRVLNNQVFELIDSGAAQPAFCPIWAETVDGVVVPLLPDADDTAGFSGNQVAPRVGANFRFKDAVLFQLYNPGANTWHTLCGSLINGVPSAWLDQAGDTDLEKNCAYAPVAAADSNVRFDERTSLFQLYIAAAALWFAIFVRLVNGVHVLAVANEGVE
jgi:hypothetical protein